MLEFRQNLQKNSLDIGKTKDDSHLVVGIDASRNRSGGVRAHIQGILHHFDAEQGVKTVHLWAYQALLDEIADRPWLVKHHHRLLERSLPFQLVLPRFAGRGAQMIVANIGLILQVGSI